MPSLDAAADDVDVDDTELSCGGCHDDVKYRELYSCCWHTERDQRPSAVQLVDLLTHWSSTTA